MRNLLLGLASATAGLAIILGLFVILLGRSSAAMHWEIKLGLAGFAVLSAVGQLLGLVGGALAHRSFADFRKNERRKMNEPGVR